MHFELVFNFQETNNSITLLFFLVLGDEAEKLFQKLRDRYTRAKKALQEQNKSGTSAKAVKKAREKLNSLHYMQWLDEYAKPRKSKSNLVSESDCENDNTIENKENNSLQLAMSSDENDSDDDPVQEKEKDKPNPPKQLVKNPKNVKKQDKRKVSEINDTEKEEMDLLRSVVAAAQEPQKEDDFDLFGRYVASKMRKLSKSLTDGAMETVEFNITSLLNQAKIQNVTPGPSYHQTTSARESHFIHAYVKFIVLIYFILETYYKTSGINCFYSGPVRRI